MVITGISECGVIFCDGGMHVYMHCKLLKGKYGIVLNIITVYMLKLNVLHVKKAGWSLSSKKG